MSDTPRDALNGPALDQVFRNARTYNSWSPQKVADALIRDIYDLAKWGPTSANSCPGRFLFLTSPEAKARLAPFLSASNRAKTLEAPLTVIIAYDLNFAEKLPVLFPHDLTAASWFANPDAAKETAFRNGSLQGAYLMLAARALGLDCGPMSGFKADGVNEEFFPESSLRTNFICSIGYGTPDKLFPRNPRLPFDEACRIL